MNMWKKKMQESIEEVKGFNDFNEIFGRQIDPDCMAHVELNNINKETNYNPMTRMEVNQMGTIKEEAQAYEPPQTLNIADLDKIPINIELNDGTGKDKEGVEFKYKYSVIGGKQYRVASSILGGIKAILHKMPNIQFVQVIKQGHGMNTRYQVIPYYTEPTTPMTTQEAIVQPPQ